MSIVSDLKRICHTEVHGLYERSPLVKSAKEGDFTHRQLECYLKSLEYLFKVNADHIFQATQVYSNDTQLSEFFMEKWREEKGHDAWARNDLKKIEDHGMRNGHLQSLNDLVDFLEMTMKSHSFSYVAYLYYAEYLTAEIGPDWMATVMGALKIGPKSITALSHHVHLDGDHAGEVLEFLSSIEITDIEKHRVYSFVKDLTLKYERFFNEIWEIEHGCKERNQDTGKISTAS